jgi:hypothetical protein
VLVDDLKAVVIVEAMQAALGAELFQQHRGRLRALRQGRAPSSAPRACAEERSPPPSTVRRIRLPASSIWSSWSPIGTKLGFERSSILDAGWHWNLQRRK